MTEDKKLQERIEAYIQEQANRDGKQAHQQSDNGRTEQKMVSKKKHISTLNGWLLPAKRKKDPVFCNIFAPDMRELYRSKKAILIDPYARKGAWVEKSYKKAWHGLLCMVRVIWLLRTRYHKAAAAFRREEKRLTGRKFWLEYLGLVSGK